MLELLEYFAFYSIYIIQSTSDNFVLLSFVMKVTHTCTFVYNHRSTGTVLGYDVVTLLIPRLFSYTAAIWMLGFALILKRALYGHEHSSVTGEYSDHVLAGSWHGLVGYFFSILP